MARIADRHTVQRLENSVMLELGLNIIVWGFIVFSAIGLLLAVGTFWGLFTQEYKRRERTKKMRETLKSEKFIFKTPESQARKTTGQTPE